MLISDFLSQWFAEVTESYRGLPFGHQLRNFHRREQRPIHLATVERAVCSLDAGHGRCGMDADNAVNEQPDCAFLSRLPFDVREIIYLDVMGRRSLYIHTKYGRLTHTQVEEVSAYGDNQEGHSGPCAARFRGSGINQRLRARHSLSLLLSCHKIYDEAIDVLYRTNMFIIPRTDTAITFLTTIVPSRSLPVIRHFSLLIDLPKHPYINHRARRDWDDLFRFLSTWMTGLRSLHLDLNISQSMRNTILSTSDDNGNEWLKPVIAMTLKLNNHRQCSVTLGCLSLMHDLMATGLSAKLESNSDARERVLIDASVDLYKRIRTEQSKVYIGGKHV